MSRELVKETYAAKGRPSIDPVVFFKLQLVMFFEDIRSERLLMQLVADKLSVRWYVGYNLDEPLPDHASLTRIRERYGVEVFRRFFEAIVERCQAAGLVWGQELYLIEFLELTWPSLDSMPSSNPGESLKSEIRRLLDSSDWDYKSLFYNCLQLGSCDDELFTSFLAACIHPLVRTDKTEMAELLSFFNEALHPDGYAFKLVSMESGRSIHRAYAFGTNDEDYIVPQAIAIIEKLARKFHLVVRKLSQRHENRPSLEIHDEYDVQDLFYALLTPFFEDIRPEEVAPSHAGGHGRIDFLIKAEQIVIEIKKTRPSLKVKELRDQLIVDKDIYRTHPNCRTFIAFIYDPDGYIDNTIGFERDLSSTPGDIRVKVIVAPR